MAQQVRIRIKMNFIATKGTKFKDTELGLISADWKVISASEYCIHITDGTHDTPKPSNTGFPLITTKNLKNGRIDLEGSYLICDEDYYEVSKRSKVDQYDVLIGMIGTIGSPVLIMDKAPAFAIKNIGVFKTGNEVAGSFLYHFLCSTLFFDYISRRGSGSTQKYIPLGLLRTLPIPLPPLAEQQRIAAVLNTLQEEIAAQEDVIAAAKDFKRSLMQRLFTYGPGAEPAPTKMTEIGEIPAHWQLKYFGEVATLQRGRDLPSQHRMNGQYPVIGSSGVVGYHHEHFVEPHCVTVGRSGSVGKLFFYEGKAWALNTALYIKDFHGNDAKFVFHLLSRFDFSSHASGVSVPTLNRNLVHKALLAVPAQDEQRLVALLIDDAEAKISAEESVISAMKSMYLSILHQLMTGQIRLLEA